MAVLLLLLRIRVLQVCTASIVCATPLRTSTITRLHPSLGPLMISTLPGQTLGRHILLTSLIIVYSLVRSACLIGTCSTHFMRRQTRAARAIGAARLRKRQARAARHTVITAISPTGWICITMQVSRTAHTRLLVLGCGRGRCVCAQGVEYECIWCCDWGVPCAGKRMVVAHKGECHPR